MPLPSSELNRILSSLPRDLLDGLSTPPIIKDLTPLTGGLTNSNHLVSILTKNGQLSQFVIREISESSTSNLNIDRLSEIHNSSLAWQWRLSPRLLSVINHQAHDSETHKQRPKYMILEYIKGETLSNQDVQKMCQDPDGVGVIVHVLKGLHRGGIGSKTHGQNEETATFQNRFDIIEVRSEYLKVCEKERWELPEGYRDLEQALQEVISILDPPDAGLTSTSISSSKEPLVPCHNDLLAANFILDDQGQASTSSPIDFDTSSRLKLIDFEYSGLNYPSFDLGNFYSETELSEDQLRSLITTYWSRDSDGVEKRDPRFLESKMARAKLWAGVAQMCWVVWATIQANSGGTLAGNGQKRQKSEETTESEKKEREEYLDWREVKMKSARKLLGEEGRLEREKLIRDVQNVE